MRHNEPRDDRDLQTGMNLSLLARPLALIAALCLLTTSTCAGDAAARRVLGFSPDGRYFAFEQFTQFYDATEVLDEIVVIDTAADRFVKGAPLRLETTSDDERDVAAVRAALLAKAKPLLARHQIGAPGTRFAGKPSIGLDEVEIYQTATEPLATAQAIALPDGRQLTLTVSDTPLGPAECRTARGVTMEVAAAGVTLKLSIDGAAPKTLAQDHKLPAARRCVSGYGIAEILHHQGKDGAQTLAVVLEMVDHANYHAGPNRRFMAVTTRLPRR
jgi:predicted secreted protein